MYFTVKELAGVTGMPLDIRNVRILVEKWATTDQKRKRENVNTRKPTEYHIDCLPLETRVALMQKHASEEAEQAVEIPREATSEELWYEFDLATDMQKVRAKKNLELCLRVEKYIESGMTRKQAMHQVSEEAGVSYGRIHRWFYINPGFCSKKQERIPKSDWLARLLDKRGGANRVADIPDEAWELFKADYLRPEMKSGTVTEVYRRLQNIAAQRNWELPCIETFKNRIKMQIPKELVLLKRFGIAEFQKAVIPAQRRTRKGLHAMQVVAGDGHVARVFCKTDNGKVFRPTVWAFIDVYSSMIVGYSVDVSENTEMLGIALHNMVNKYGIPTKYILDRGSVALSEAMTGQQARPKRDGSGKLMHKKFDASEIEGAMTAMGSTVNWIRSFDDNEGRSGNSRANPVERLWHSKAGFGQFERHPAFAGAYTGASITDKPANYSEKNAVSFDVFLTHLDAWVHQWNNEEGRRTEMAKSQGLSYAQVFERSYEQSMIAKPTAAQLALCLLRTRKAVKVHTGGMVELNAGYYSSGATNRYQSPLLYEYIDAKVRLRFNPYDLTQYVLAFTEDDRFIGRIPLESDVNVLDVGAARRKSLLGDSELTRTEMMGELMIGKSIDDLAAAYAPQEHETTDIGGAVPAITQMVSTNNMPKDFGGYETKRKRAVGHDTLEEDYSEFNSDEVTASLIRQFGK